MAFNLKNKPATYAISDRISLKNRILSSYAGSAADAGVDMFQIREKDLSDADLLLLVKQCLEERGDSQMKILVNTRLDIALAAGADGVHLPSAGHSAASVRQVSGDDFIIGKSTHSLTEAKIAKEEGADFITFGPVFFTQSKAKYGDPVGLRKLEEIISEVDIPVFALGGISEATAADLFDLSLGGFAAISLFQNATDLAFVVSSLRQKLEF